MHYPYLGYEQIVGQNMIVGADDYSQLPASMQGQATTPNNMGGPRLVRVNPTQARELLLGFGPSSIAQSATSSFTTQPQLPFRPARFVIPSATVANFSVNDLKVGKNSQFLSSNSVPAAVFSELAVGVALGLDTCDIGQQITVSVTAISGGGPYTFAAALIGTSLQAGQ